MSSPVTSPRTIQFGEYSIDLETSELRTNGNKFLLQEQSFQVLRTLLERPGELVTREELKNKLWSEGTFVDFDHSLNKAVNRLRSVLADSAETPRFIQTIPRRGYRFIGPVDLGGAVTRQISRLQGVGT
jgi:DNA-binding winged helix-turn-helix (wHTH) protein